MVAFLLCWVGLAQDTPPSLCAHLIHNFWLYLTAAILQHYELWPTQYVDVTRSLANAVAFARGDGNRKRAFLYVFAMPDLRGSITSDMDQHLTLARLEAICPPAARRPHAQDAYLVARFPEPPNLDDPRDFSWEAWKRKTDLMRRLVARFEIRFEGNKVGEEKWLAGADPIGMDRMLPIADPLAIELKRELLSKLTQFAQELSR